MKKLQEVHNNNILLDTNILIHYADDEFAERSGKILRVLQQNKNLLSISEITGFELLNCHLLRQCPPGSVQPSLYVGLTIRISFLELNKMVPHEMRFFWELARKIHCQSWELCYHRGFR